MPIGFPDNLFLNNDAFPLIKASDLTVQGWFHVATTGERNLIPETKRIEGAVVVVGQVPYLYESADLGTAAWTDADNWKDISEGGGSAPPTAIGDLTDVDLAGIGTGDLLAYTASSDFEPFTLNYVTLPGAPTLAAVATTGEYTDLGNKPIFQAGSNMQITETVNGSQSTFEFSSTGGGGGGVSNLNDLSDVDRSNVVPTDTSGGQILYWDVPSQKWRTTLRPNSATAVPQWDQLSQTIIWNAGVLDNTSITSDLADFEQMVNPFLVQGQMIYNTNTTNPNRANWRAMQMVSNPTDGQILSWSAALNQPTWAAAPSTTVASISDIGNVNPNVEGTGGNLMFWNGFEWVGIASSGFVSTGGNADQLDDIYYPFVPGEIPVNNVLMRGIDPNGDGISTIWLVKTPDDLKNATTYNIDDINGLPVPSLINSGGVVRVNSAGNAYDLVNLSTVAQSGDYNDLSNTPTLGSAAAVNIPAAGQPGGSEASATQAVRGDDKRLSQKDCISVVIETPAQGKTYKLVLKMPHDGTITDITSITGSGGITYNVAIDSVNVGSNLSALTTESSSTTFTNASFSAGDEITLVVVAVIGSGSDLAVTINYDVTV